MSGVVEAWPFIATRNATLDWRPILAPPFLIKVRSDYLLVTETSGADPHLLLATRKLVDSDRAGAITLVFSSRVATTELLGHEPPEPLLDRFGRPVHVVEGLVFRGRPSVSPSEQEASLAAVRALTREQFPVFWHQVDEGVPPKHSAAMRMPTDSPAAVATTDVKPKGGSHRSLPLLMAVVLTVIAVVWWRARAGS